jgi:hypothetical protein
MVCAVPCWDAANGPWCLVQLQLAVVQGCLVLEPLRAERGMWSAGNMA